MLFYKIYGYYYYTTYFFQEYDWSIAVRDCGINSVINFTLLKVTIYKPHYARNRFS